METSIGEEVNARVATLLDEMERLKEELKHQRQLRNKEKKELENMQDLMAKFQHRLDESQQRVERAETLTARLEADLEEESGEREADTRLLVSAIVEDVSFSLSKLHA